MEPTFLQALVYVLMAALLGGLMVWLWNRLRIKDLHAQLTAQENQFSSSQEALKKLQQSTDSQQNDYNRMRDQLALLQTQEVQWKQAIQAKATEEKALQEWQTKAQQTEKELQQLRAQLTEQALESENGVSTEEWEAKLEKVEQARLDLQQELAEAAKREARWHDEINQSQNKITELEAKVKAVSQAPVKPAVPAKPSPSPAPSPAKAAKTAPLSENQLATLARIQERAQSLNFEKIGTATPEEKDDLRKIKGIGPFSEQKLNSIGIFTYRQLSKLDNEDQEKLNEVIEFFPGRIKRDQWALQARKLMKQEEAD